MPQASDRTKKLVKQATVVSAICAAIVAAFWLRVGVSFVMDQKDNAGVTDTVKLGAAHGALGVEQGEFRLSQYRPASPGSWDVTRYPQVVRDAIAAVHPVHGLIWEGKHHNAITHLGAYNMLNCTFKVTSCATSGMFYVALFKTATLTRAATVTTGINELTSGVETGYARINLTAANWTVTQGTPSNAVTASKQFTAGAAWTVKGLAIVDASGTTTANVWAYSNFDRTLASSDTLTVTYTLNLQSTAD